MPVVRETSNVIQFPAMVESAHCLICQKEEQLHRLKRTLLTIMEMLAEADISGRG